MARYLLTPSDVTPKAAWINRRTLLAGLGGSAAALGLPLRTQARELSFVPSAYSTDAKPNTFEEITSYNNFYEFGFDKGDPKRYAGALTTSPWEVLVDGLVGRPATYALEDLIGGIPLEERIYRFRCVEAWSMVIPWIGFPLAALIERLQPEPDARYVSFETLVRPEEMRGQRRPLLDWPYREGLRMDEAMHPLTIIAVGLYGEILPNQNGAPLRLVVPWKYGFKSIKSLVRISFTADEPPTTWSTQAPEEYGFYANVNPEVDHPRWSQASERRIGAGLLARREPTLMFNGYEDEVAGLYAGMDLRRFY